MRVPAHHVALSCCLLGLVFTVVAAVGLGALDRPTREQGAASPVKDDPLVAAMQNAPRANAIVATPTMFITPIPPWKPDCCDVVQGRLRGPTRNR